MKREKKIKLYPLKFKNIESSHPWGSEKWQLVSLDYVSSSISNGFLAENNLDDIIETYMGDLVGEKIFDIYNLYFPLIVKTALIHGNTSVQVHPSDEVGFERYDRYGKSKFWYVVDTEPDAKIYMGFSRDVSASEFYLKSKDGSLPELLNVINPEKGDCFLITPGTVHSSKGVEIIEIQENSDLAFRLYDWGRENNPETARPMDLEEAIDIIDYKKYDGEGFSKVKGGTTRLATDPHFIVNHISLEGLQTVDISKFESCVIYICIDGSFEIISDDGFRDTVSKGELIMVPALSADLELRPVDKTAHLLEVSVPEAEPMIDSYTNQVIENDSEKRPDRPQNLQ